jgi:hypothetical protein
MTLLATLTGSLVKHDSSGSRYVKGTYSSSHRNAEQMVACAADQIVKSGAFAPEDKNAVAGEVEPVVVGSASLV